MTRGDLSGDDLFGAVQRYLREAPLVEEHERREAPPDDTWFVDLMRSAIQAALDNLYPGQYKHELVITASESGLAMMIVLRRVETGEVLGRIYWSDFTPAMLGRYYDEPGRLTWEIASAIDAHTQRFLDVPPAPDTL